jgi:hypothetical protein
MPQRRNGRGQPGTKAREARRYSKPVLTVLAFRQGKARQSSSTRHKEDTAQRTAAQLHGAPGRGSKESPEQGTLVGLAQDDIMTTRRAVPRLQPERERHA